MYRCGFRFSLQGHSFKSKYVQRHGQGGFASGRAILNEIIAKEEIDVLLDKKIFVNAKRYSSEGEEKELIVLMMII